MRDQQHLAVMRLDASESAQAGWTLGRAFRDDPLWAAVLRDSDRRPEMLIKMFTGLAKATLAAQGVAEKTTDLGGVALWLPPRREIGLWAMARSGFAMPRFVMSLPRRDRKRMLTVLSQIGERKQALMPGPHWYLAAIGIDPDYQGRGLGSALMQHGIARADRDSRPVYLETETKTNVGFYQRLGFGVIEELTPEGLDFPMWLMARTPSPRGP